MIGACDPAVAQRLASAVMNQFDAFHYICRHVHGIAVGVYPGNQNLYFHLHPAITKQRFGASIVARIKLDLHNGKACEYGRSGLLIVCSIHAFTHDVFLRRVIFKCRHRKYANKKITDLSNKQQSEKCKKHTLANL
ncbi:hypothetical protein EMIT0P265_110183 [Pseudomonas zeae]